MYQIVDVEWEGKGFENDAKIISDEKKWEWIVTAIDELPRLFEFENPQPGNSTSADKNKITAEIRETVAILMWPAFRLVGATCIVATCKKLENHFKKLLTMHRMILKLLTILR